ncbi:MAG TPA: hypothetical protein VG032_05110 [Acidimicrobiales bacterium]|nr:hypothetical protein [Acidimicrobiales bacterium]
MRALELSRAVVAPPPPAVDGTDRTRIRHRLVEGVTREVERLPGGEHLVITLPMFRRALARPDLVLGPGDPFAWQPKFVRRSLGLAVVEACAEGRFRSPAEAARPIAGEAVEEWGRTGWKALYWEPWFAGLEPAARAVVLAEAVSWATALWTSFDWDLLGDRLRLGGPDDQWVIPGPRTVRLKGRRELQVPTVPPGADGSRPEPGPLALVSVSAGTPTPTWSEELAFLAVVALRSDSRALPARVAGLWPDAGTHRIVEIDQPALERTVDRLLAVVATLVDARVSGLAAR